MYSQTDTHLGIEVPSPWTVDWASQAGLKINPDCRYVCWVGTHKLHPTTHHIARWMLVTFEQCSQAREQSAAYFYNSLIIQHYMQKNH
jgi:hypothetical protein